MGKKSFTDEDRQAYREAKRESAEAALDALLTQDGFQTWLRLRRNLHSFSMTNQVLIAIGAHEQATAADAELWARDGWANGAPDTPCDADPTIVKSAGRWKQDGYHPAKGTRGLTIWAYASRKRKDGSWTCNGDCGRRHGPTERECSGCGKQDHYFKLAPVFDASQVRSFETGERPEAPDLAGEPITGDELAWMLEPLAAWAVDAGVCTSVDLDATSDHGEGGSYNTQTGELRVCEGTGNHRVRVLLHELAHARGITSRGDLDLTYAEAEVAVECVSYMVAASAGLDTSGEAIPYMAGWGGEDARAKVRALAKLIDQTAKELEAPVLALLEENTDRVALVAA
jgi:hypothetical protein